MADTTAPTPSDASAPSSIDVGDNLRTAERFREVGKAHFQAGDYKAALVEFHQIYMYVHGFSPKGGSGDMMAGLGGKASSEAHVGVDDMRRVNELKLVHFSNVALCHLKLGNAPKCITYCTRVGRLAPPARRARARPEGASRVRARATVPYTGARSRSRQRQMPIQARQVPPRHGRPRRRARGPTARPAARRRQPRDRARAAAAAAAVSRARSERVQKVQQDVCEDQHGCGPHDHRRCGCSTGGHSVRAGERAVTHGGARERRNVKAWGAMEGEGKTAANSWVPSILSFVSVCELS